EGVIEAGWLAALIVAPLFFNVYSSRVFEPDKISLVRSVALVMLLAYLVKLADGGRAWLLAHGAEDDSASSADAISAPWYRRWLRVPFLLPLALLVLAYAVSTALSVAPTVSWWGSYQRLQGTYSFLSYITIALLTAAHLRRPDQLRRLQHTIILTSLPIAIYGVIQHFGIDPLPWGGDVQTRVSGNAGNPIFLAAYLIMAFFLTLERIYSSFAFLLSNEDAEDEAAEARRRTFDMPSALVGGSYLFVLIVQALAIFWTQSRGPWLGLAAGLYIFVLLLLTGLRPRHYRAWTATWVGLGFLGALFLVLINVTPLGEPLRSMPYVGRLTTILDTNEGTNLVRTLIWEGVADMVTPHDPIVFPDGEPDAVNPIRPLVGYGPEAMWVAYNSFYPPGLAQVEARNASPDRSHNETWDSLAITGGFGFVAYVLLFMTIFYWSLRWLGLITGRRDLIVFLSFWLGGGAVLTGIFVTFDQSWRFFGVALPVGFIIGLILYLTLAVFIHPGARIEREDRRRQLLIIAILAAVTAHFVEIHTGIAIAATRTYFWVLAAMLLVVGMRWLTPESFANLTPVAATAARTSSARGRSRRARTDAPVSEGGLLPSTVLPDLLVMLTLAFLYTTNFQGFSNPFEILIFSVTRRMQDGAPVGSPAILFLVIFTWLIAVTIGLSVAALRRSQPADAGWWARGFAGYSFVLWGGWLIYGLIQAGRLVAPEAGTDLATQLNHIAGHFTLYTWIVVIWALGAAVAFAWSFFNQRRPVATQAVFSVAGGAVILVAILAIVSTVNVALVRADIFYKQGQQFDANGDWVGSVELYRRALAVRPSEDHYMLFLGRALLEQAKKAPVESPLTLPQSLNVDDVIGLTAEEVAQMGREDLLRAAETILLRAQEVNPLNTDHTANLARLYRSWADLSSDPTERATNLEKSLDFYNVATTLSPNAAHLWNEKGGTLVLLGRTDEAEDVYRHSLSLDDRFEQTYLLLADLLDQQQRNDDLIALLDQGIENVPNSNQLRSFLSVVQARAGELDDALATNLAIVDRTPNDANAVRNLAILYRDLQQPDEAIKWAQNGIEIAQAQNLPQVESDMHRLLIEIYNQQGNTDQVIAQYEAMAAAAPQDVALLANLATLYIQNDRLPQAEATLQQLMTLQPDNYDYPFRLAQIYATLGRLDEARTSAEQALPLAPDTVKPAVEQFLATLEG
ncbi:MAG: tetratricopeptide repeat protein, partial [Caldilineaceae bacterium]|nr:tetratricopeptide repeat protein [Caldilineaceae bacterium]